MQVVMSAPHSAPGPGWICLSWFLVAVGRKDVGPWAFLAANSLKHILAFFFFFSCFLVNFECLKESLFLCRFLLCGGDLVLSISFGLVLGSRMVWRSLPSPSKRGKWEFAGEGILSCPFCIYISALWHFLQKEPGDPGRVWGQSEEGKAAPRR